MTKICCLNQDNPTFSGFELQANCPEFI